MGELTQLLAATGRGESHATDEVLLQVYSELRRLAAYRLAHEPPGQTLQATALVHEAYLRLVHGGCDRWEDRRHFFNSIAEAMRRILVENARRKKRLKHGGELQRVNLDDAAPASPVRPEELLALDEALGRLALEDPEAARLVEFRFFVGLRHQEAAEAMGISRRTADGLWAYARSWIFDALSRPAAGP